MALPAGRLDVSCRQDRLLPGLRTAVSLFNGGRRALPTVTHYAAELVKRVRDYRMPAKRLGKVGIGQARFFQPGVAGGAAIYDPKLRMPDLLDAVVEVALQCYRFSPAPNQRQILILVMTPFTEVVLSRRNGQRNQQQEAEHAKSANRMAEQRLPHGRQRFLQLAPPRQHPGPTRAAKESANRREHDQFEQKPGHDPV